MPLQLLRIRDAGVRRGIGPMARHRVEGIERGVVFAELDVRVAEDAVVPRVVRVHARRAGRDVDRLAEAVL